MILLYFILKYLQKSTSKWCYNQLRLLKFTEWKSEWLEICCNFRNCEYLVKHLTACCMCVWYISALHSRSTTYILHFSRMFELLFEQTMLSIIFNINITESFVIATNLSRIGNEIWIANALLKLQLSCRNRWCQTENL